MKRFVLVSFLVALLITGLGGSLQAQGEVQVLITAPTDGFLSFEPTITVQGKALIGNTAPKLVLIHVNGKAMKVELAQDGSFSADVELEFFGENIVSATAIGANQEIGSARISVLLQRQVLFFDDFEGGQPRPEWAPASGTWVISPNTPSGRAYTLSEERWRVGTFTYVMAPGSSEWTDYAIDVDVSNARGSSGGYAQELGIVFRAKDDLSKVILQVQSDGWICWRTVTDGQWSNCNAQVQPGLVDRQHLRIEVLGNTYTLYVNEVKRTSWTDLDNKYSKGTVGLYLYNKTGASFDNFKVTALFNGPQSPLAKVDDFAQSPDWERVQAQLTSVQALDTRVSTLQATVSDLVSQRSLADVEVTPADLDALSQRMSSMESLLAQWGQDKRVDTVQAVVGEQVTQLRRMSDTVERVTGEFEQLKREAEASIQIARELDSKATLALILGGIGTGVALLVALRILG